jgi:hypothetical protein
VFDFRYHALSLGAVFLALAIGIVLGATIGDSLVTDARNQLRNDLKEDVQRANRERDDAKDALQRSSRVSEAVFPILARDRLAGERVATVAIGGLPEDVQADVRKAVETAGGDLNSVSVLDVPGSVADLQQAVGGSLATSPPERDVLEQLGRRIARSLVAGGRVARRLAKDLPDRFQGDYGPLNAVVLYRSPPEKDQRGREDFEKGLIKGLTSGGIPVVGIETVGTNPSQISWYADNGLSSAEPVDDVGGRLALILALAGAEGNFGTKKASKDGPLPKAQSVP